MFGSLKGTMGTITGTMQELVKHAGLTLLFGILLARYVQLNGTSTAAFDLTSFLWAFGLQVGGIGLALGLAFVVWHETKKQLKLRADNNPEKPATGLVVFIGLVAVVIAVAGVCMFLLTVSADTYKVFSHLNIPKWLGTEQFHKSGFQALTLDAFLAVMLHFEWDKIKARAGVSDHDDRTGPLPLSVH